MIPALIAYLINNARYNPVTVMDLLTYAKSQNFVVPDETYANFLPLLEADSRFILETNANGLATARAARNAVAI